ncbi:uncharacterized protein [Temnothorax longispinosus]|uniref:uncharacterized protein n=1 Tax=Temnothorax longispinosus TaxID=300112 RepID=UPI003A98D3A1
MRSHRAIMLLPMFLVWILASANAELFTNITDKIPKLNPSERIPRIPDLFLPVKFPEDALLTTMELISKYGYDGELHRVTTSDGYILELHRIKGRANSTNSNVQKPIAFVMHGIFCDSSSWAISGRERSLAFILADEGFDVWLGNARGNPYANTHVSEKISMKEYWNFSWNEIGTRDLPAMIDRIVETTGRKKMFYLAHSQGTTAFFVMATGRPQYQEYIEEMYAMAPIAYCGRMKSPLFQLLAQFVDSIDLLFNLIGMYKFNPTNDFVTAVEQLVCAEDAITQPICSNSLFLATGFDIEQFDPALLPVILGHVPVDTATMQLVHYAQLIKSGRLISPGKFRQYDHGIFGDEDLYGTSTPPSYDLSKIKVPIYLYYSENDWLANVKDVEKLYSELGNPAGKILIADKKFNHVDYVWAKDVKTLVYDQIISQMKKSSLYIRCTFGKKIAHNTVRADLLQQRSRRATSTMPILLLLILASASAMPYSSMDQLPDVPSIDKIPMIKEFEDPEFLIATQADTSLSILQLVSKFGYHGELHEVLTSDGYILEMHRITGRTNYFNNSQVQKPVAFVMHGLLCSSACWVVPGPQKSLALILADAGYDVWLGNTRGNVYGRKHLLPDIRRELFWDFSWHEIGVYDLPAMIDYILKITGRQKIFYLGHSQGTTSFFVMSSERPEYQDKIQAMFALAPVAYCARMDNPIMQFIARFSGPLEELMKLIGMYDFEPTSEALKIFARIVCAEDAITQPLCSNILFLFGGFNKDQLNTTLLPLILEHVPAGSSTKQFMHYAQLVKTGFLITRGKFRQYDYSWAGNLMRYGTFSPPEYNLGKIKVPVSLHYSTNDWLANVKDVDELYKDLGNPIGKFRVPLEKFSHLDFMWAKDAKDLLFDKILSLMTNFQD